MNSVCFRRKKILPSVTEALSHYADWQKNQDKYNLCICIRDKMFALLYQANALPEKNDDKSVINEDKGLS